MGIAALVVTNAVDVAEIAARREAVREVTESGGMRGAAQQRKLFQYLAERAVAGVTEAADEYTVATRVLGRPLDFDPVTDAGVRQLKLRLGQRLEEYYAGDGKRSRLRLVVDRGLCLRFVRVQVVTGVAVAPPRVPGAGGLEEMAHGLLLAALAETPGLRICPARAGRGDCEYFLEGEFLDSGNGECLWCLRLGESGTGAVVFSSVSTLRHTHLLADVRVAAERVREQLGRMTGA